MKTARSFFYSALGLLILLATSACSVPRYDPATEEGKRGIIDAVNIALTQGDCSKAVELIEPLYNSKYTDNEVRLLRASAHACNAGVQFFPLVGELISSNIVGSGFWMTMARLFPSKINDIKVESGWFATDALMATLKGGTVLIPSTTINSGTDNPGSIKGQDRTNDANLFTFFVSLSTIGALQNRYSATNPSNYHKTQVLGYTAAKPQGWALPANMTEEGCSFASALLNMVDSTANITNAGLLQNAFSAISNLGVAFDAACEAGCTGALPTGCTFPAGSCASCPISLRKRDSCTPVDTDINSCAAAGIISFINTDPTLGWP